MSPSMQVPFHRPSIGTEEIEEVVRTLQSGWLTTGARAAQFEEDFRNYVATPHALATSSGTAALHLALAGLGVGPGDEVITTPLTFCATVNMILKVGAVPVLADVGEDGNIDPAAVGARITPRTRAIMPVHFAGLPCQMEAIWNLARENRLLVIEDAAHAAGACYRGRFIGAAGPPGGSSDAVAFSFHPTKNLTTGEGGMVVTANHDLAETMRLLCLHGISKNAWNRYTDRGNWYYEVLLSGFKYNLTDIQAAIGIHQLRKLESFIRRRAALAKLYNELLADVEEVQPPPDDPSCRHAWHLYVLRLNLDQIEFDRAEFVRTLKARGIGTSVHFIPIPLHPFFAPYKSGNSCPRALALYERILSLPLYPAMTEAQVELTAGAIADIARSARKHRVVSLGAALMD